MSSSETRGSDSEIIRFSGLAAGTYYVKVQGNAGAVNKYTLDWDRSNYGPKPDSNDAAGKPGNNTLATATNLSVLSRSGVAASIHSATDVDYYKFVLDAGGTSGNFFRINFTDADGDLDLLLYDAGGNLVSSSETRGSDSEIIRFSGFAAGTYYVKVQGNAGAVNNYTLDWDRSNYAPKPDSNDAAGKSNDTLQTATNLNKFIGGLEASIHSDTDVDFFKLALDGVGTAKNYAKISFAGVEGDLDLFLYDEAGALLASSASRTGNSEYISLNNMEAGIYYLKVSGNNGALNTYALEWDRTTYGILTDIHDRAGTVGNNTLATATDLGSSANSGSAMSIHSQHDVDYYAISLAADGRSPNYAQIVFDQQNGNLDLQLLDANGNAVAVQAAAAQGSKRLDLSGLSAGAYYLRVSGVGKTANTYSLAWDSRNYAPVADAADAVGAAGNDTMGTATALTQTTGSNTALSIHSATDVDYYKLILDGVGGAANYARIDFQERDGKLELFLLDESGNMARAASAGAGAASVDLAALAPGTYYLKVAGSAGATNNYTLSWDRKNYTPAADSNDAAGTTGNDTLASATILNKLANTGAQASIHTAADVDYYQLVLTDEGAARNFVRISFDGSMGNLALQLYDAAGQEIAGAVTGGVNEKRADLNGLAPGTYYVKVSSSDGSVNSYSLDWDRTSYAVAPDANDRPGTAGNDSIATATALNKLAGAGVQASIHTAADVDYYQLVLTDEGAAKNFARICFDGSRGNLALQLYDAAGQEITGAITDGVNEKRAELDGLAPGTYYVKVSSSDGSVNSYSLDWDRTPYAVAPDANDRSGTAGNDSIATATALNANAKSGVGATIHSATDVDYYALTLTKKGTTNNFFQINFTNADGNLDLALYDANGNEIMASRSAMADSERLNLAGVAAGVYYVKVSGANGDANKYTMSWDRTAYTVTPRSDKFENNNTIAKARALPFQAGSYTGATSISGAADVDYFKFSLSMRGTNANYFTISGINATGQVELTLVNAQGDLMRKAISLSRTSQKLDLAALDPGTYYIKISSPDGATANYNISWNCWSQAQNLSLKNQPGRWNEDRFEAETERLVTALGYSGSAPGVNIHDSADVDYYKITLMETGSSRNYAQINYDQSWGTLSLTLYDAAGNVIDISDSRSGSEKISMAGLAEGTYYAVVEAAEATNNNAYTFKWNRSPGQQIVQENTLAGFSNTLANLAITENAPWQSWSFSLYAEATVENYISVSCADPLAIRLRDAAGRIVFSANSLEKINLGGLQSGNYSLEIGPGDLIAGDASAYTLEYDLGVHIRGNKARGAEYSSLFAIGDNEYACISGYGNVTLADFQKGTWAGERLRSYDDAVYYDAEKCVQDRKDDNQCWAAVASNMLAYSGWGESGITSATGDYAEDIIYDAYNAAFPNVGGMVEDALRWFFGPNYRSYSNSPTASKAGNYLHMEGSPYITMNYMNSISAMDQLASALQAGMAVGLSISGSVRHAVTVWGYTFNAAKEKGTAGYYTGLFITDSDNAKNVADSRNAPDCLQLISISWNAAHNGYYTSYAGSNRLDRFYTLDQAANQQTADLTDAAYAQLPDDMLQEGRLDGLLAQAMEPTPAMFQAGAELAHDGRETRNTGMLCA
ncbi:T9SS type A sorting domain-containing protein [uncultured Desulfovibrio sp.]|uniref:T9SS type A sorting domain-containing protein n=1 Tax=uncultured Desulfovibrio sp. TaxID=167968 RepID=UPI00266F8AA0|nr:T9SS type A sorting domain-containing protein [uncultured Desulfovibrio sp.]